MFGVKSEKIFCIGLNKTGTTSIGSFLENVGYNVAKQREGELLLDNYIKRDFKTIIKYCKKSNSNVYQDVPFSLPYTFMHLDNAFPKSKFILTIRDTPEIWYNSILKFHSDFYNFENKLVVKILQESKYVYKGWSWKLMREVFLKNEVNSYDKQEFVDAYNNYQSSVIEYFKNKEDKLIVINLSKDEDFKKLCSFLNIKTELDEFPRISSKDIHSKNYEVKFLK